MNDANVIARIMETMKTIAVVGFSSRSFRAGYYVPAYLSHQGYHIIPVNPNLQRGLGQRAYPDLLAVPHPVDLVLIFRRSEHVGQVVDQAIEIGAKGVWMQLNVIDQKAAERAQAAGLDMVMNVCLMVEHRRWAGD